MTERITIQYRYSADEGSWTDWEVASTVDGLWGTTNSGTATFNPSDGDGYYEFKAEATDRSGRTEPMSTDPEAQGALDTTAPTGSILINGGDTATGETTVTLILTHEDALSGVYMIRLSDEPIVGDEPLLPAVETKSWELPDEGGEHTVYYQIRDGAAVFSQVYTATIALDRDEPTGSIALQGGATATNVATVTLILTHDDPTTEVVGIRVSNEAIGGNEPWENPVEALEHLLSAGDGAKTIYFQVRDAAGRESPVYPLTITLDTTNPFVETTDPVDGDEKVARDKAIVVRFSEPMDQTSVETAFALEWVDKDGVAHSIDGNFSWSPDGRTITFKPATDLEGEGGTFRIKLATGANDLAGNTIYPDIDYSFTAEKLGDDGDGSGGLMGSFFIWIVLVVIIVIVFTLIFAWRNVRG